MNVLSVFDGMSCGQIALNRLGIKVDTYYASEIDKHAMNVTKTNFPNTKHIGDVTKVFAKDLPKIDLLIGGSPCQGFSFAGKQLNFNDPRSKLFFEFVRLLKEIKEINPDIKFLLENVKMKKEFLGVISSALGVTPILINSQLVSAQSRYRYYWTNIPGSGGLYGNSLEQPIDKGIILKDIMEDVVDEKYYISSDKEIIWKDYIKNPKANLQQLGYFKTPAVPSSRTGFVGRRIYEDTGKSTTLTTTNNGGGGMYLVGNIGTKKDFGSNTIHSLEGKSKTLQATAGGQGRVSGCYTTKDFRIRRLTPNECEKLQTVPSGYTEVDGVSESQRYKMLGNGWTVDVIVHLMKGLK